MIDLQHNIPQSTTTLKPLPVEVTSSNHDKMNYMEMTRAQANPNTRTDKWPTGLNGSSIQTWNSLGLI